MAKSESSPIRNHTKNSLTQREAGIVLHLLGKFKTSPKPAGFQRDGKSVALALANVEAFVEAVEQELNPTVVEESTDAPESADEAPDAPEAEASEEVVESDQDDDNSVPEIDGEDIG